MKCSVDYSEGVYLVGCFYGGLYLVLLILFLLYLGNGLLKIFFLDFLFAC